MVNLTVTSFDVGSVSKLPPRHQRGSVSSSTELKHLSSKISFSGFWLAERSFVSWLGKMEALHGETWRKAGIYEAIKASTSNIRNHQSLVLSVAEKWCSETNTFIFPWGEATITLEDVMVLLGFSVLGSPVFAPLESSVMRDIAKKLQKARAELDTAIDADGGRLRESLWTSRFFGTGDELEHEAFLVLWLSLFVFPSKSSRAISSKVIPLAIRLARGERIAIAPVVLANIYRDLGQLRDLARGKYEGEKVNFKSLLKLVPIWTWERFKNARTKAKVILEGEPRIFRWDDFLQRTENVSMSLDDFVWRPYTRLLKHWNPLKYYPEEAMLVTVNDSLDDKFASFGRFVKVSRLAGDGFVQEYYPNRVARQFGLTQDLPTLIIHQRYITEKDAWDHYNRNGLMLYIPSRHDQGLVTTKYQNLWPTTASCFLISEEAKKETNQKLEQGGPSVKIEQMSNEDEDIANKAHQKRQLRDNVSVINGEKKTKVDDGTKEAEHIAQ